MTRTPEPDKLRPTPELGQHTEAVLRELGYNDAAIADLRARDVV
jgi:crotonobetainyl-CoA:carnitine CoA-transferase CaiB-like acyl-CoA transferase